jgi:hypothetical protein
VDRAHRREVGRVIPHRDERDDVAGGAELARPRSGTFATVFRGAGILLVVYLAYGGWVVVPMAGTAALIALLRCT